jgi:hypothetical protein
VSEGLAVIEGAFRDQLERARSAGLLAADTDLDPTAAALFMAFQGLLVLARAGRPDLESAIDAVFAAHLGPG